MAYLPEPMIIKCEPLDIIDLDDDKTPEEVIYEWHDKVRKELNKYICPKNETDLLRKMEWYLDELKFQAKDLQDLATLQNVMVKHVKVMELAFRRLKTAKNSDLYLDIMEEILIHFCNIVVENASQKRKIANKIGIKKIMSRSCRKIKCLLHHCLLATQERIQHVLMKVTIDPTSPACRDILNHVYGHFITRIEQEKSDASFCRGYVIFQKWKMLRKRDEAETMDKCLYRMYNQSPTILDTKEMFRRILKPDGNSIRDMTQEYFNYYKSKKKDFEKDEIIFDPKLNELSLSRSVDWEIRRDSEDFKSIYKKWDEELEAAKSMNNENMRVKNEEDDDCMMVSYSSQNVNVANTVMVRELLEDEDITEILYYVKKDWQEEQIKSRKATIQGQRPSSPIEILEYKEGTSTIGEKNRAVCRIGEESSNKQEIDPVVSNSIGDGCSSKEKPSRGLGDISSRREETSGMEIGIGDQSLTKEEPSRIFTSIGDTSSRQEQTSGNENSNSNAEIINNVGETSPRKEGTSRMNIGVGDECSNTEQIKTVLIDIGDKSFSKEKPCDTSSSIGDTSSREEEISRMDIGVGDAEEIIAIGDVEQTSTKVGDTSCRHEEPSVMDIDGGDGNSSTEKTNSIGDESSSKEKPCRTFDSVSDTSSYTEKTNTVLDDVGDKEQPCRVFTNFGDASSGYRMEISVAGESFNKEENLRMVTSFDDTSSNKEDSCKMKTAVEETSSNNHSVGDGKMVMPVGETNSNNIGVGGESSKAEKTHQMESVAGEERSNNSVGDESYNEEESTRMLTDVGDISARQDEACEVDTGLGDKSSNAEKTCRIQTCVDETSPINYTLLNSVSETCSKACQVEVNIGEDNSNKEEVNNGVGDASSNTEVSSRMLNGVDEEIYKTYRLPSNVSEMSLIQTEIYRARTSTSETSSSSISSPSYETIDVSEASVFFGKAENAGKEICSSNTDMLVSKPSNDAPPKPILVVLNSVEINKKRALQITNRDVRIEMTIIQAVEDQIKQKPKTVNMETQTDIVDNGSSNLFVNLLTPPQSDELSKTSIYNNTACQLEKSMVETRSNKEDALMDVDDNSYHSSGEEDLESVHNSENGDSYKTASHYYSSFSPLLHEEEQDEHKSTKPEGEEEKGPLVVTSSHSNSSESSDVSVEVMAPQEQSPPSSDEASIAKTESFASTVSRCCVSSSSDTVPVEDELSNGEKQHESVSTSVGAHWDESAENRDLGDILSGPLNKPMANIINPIEGFDLFESDDKSSEPKARISVIPSTAFEDIDSPLYEPLDSAEVAENFFVKKPPKERSIHEVVRAEPGSSSGLKVKIKKVVFSDNAEEVPARLNVPRSSAKATGRSILKKPKVLAKDPLKDETRTILGCRVNHKAFSDYNVEFDDERLLKGGFQVDLDRLKPTEIDRWLHLSSLACQARFKNAARPKPQDFIFDNYSKDKTTATWHNGSSLKEKEDPYPGWKGRKIWEDDHGKHSATGKRKKRVHDADVTESSRKKAAFKYDRNIEETIGSQHSRSGRIWKKPVKDYEALTRSLYKRSTDFKT